MEDKALLKRRVAKWSDPENPIRQFFNRIGDRWSLVVIIVLLSQPKYRCRFSELKKAIPGISQRMLTSTLRSLEREGFLTRHVFAEVPPRVEYELTELGRSIRVPVKSLFTWLTDNWPVERKFRETYI